MGAMQTAVVALALGKHSLPTVSEISLRFGARPAEQLLSFEVAAFCRALDVAGAPWLRELQRGTPTRLRVAVAT